MTEMFAITVIDIIEPSLQIRCLNLQHAANLISVYSIKCSGAGSVILQPYELSAQRAFVSGQQALNISKKYSCTA